VKVGAGPEGQRQFQSEVRRLLRLDDDQEFDIVGVRVCFLQGDQT